MAVCNGRETALYRSTDKGATWERRYWFGGANQNATILKLTAHPQDTSILYASGISANWPVTGRILRSDDGGLRFTRVAEAPPFSNFDFVLPGPAKDMVFAGTRQRFEFVFGKQTVFLRDSLGRRIAPGSIGSIYGAGLASERRSADGPLLDSLLGVAVRFNGLPAPLLFVSPAAGPWGTPSRSRLGIRAC